MKSTLFRRLRSATAFAATLFVAAGATAGEVRELVGSRQMVPGVTGRILDLHETAAAGYCPGSGNASPGTLPSYNWQDNFIALTRLGNHWMPTFGDGDSMTSPFWLDQGTAPPFGSDGLHETWYISRDNLANTAPFYRLLGNNNHVDSPATSEGPHTLDLDLPHGYPWTAAGTGLTPIRRYRNATINDTRTWLFSQTPAGYTLNATYWPTGA